jgi:xanthine dehydrogenase accessory factor
MPERLPGRLTWAGERSDQFPPETTARVVIEDEPIFAADDAPPGAFYLVMTHSHALDFEIVERSLQRKDARFVGMIGSDTKAAKLRSRLNARGIDSSKLISPIGLFKAGKHPAEVAVSAVAQLLQERQRTAAPAEFQRQRAVS